MSPPRRHLLAASLYLALAMLYLRPIWRVMGTHIAPHKGDPLFNLYLLKWGAHQIRLGLPSFWDAPFFYPARRVVTYSDHLLGPSLFVAAFTALVPNALAAYNLLVLSSFVLCGLATYFVLTRSGVSPAAAFLAGCMYAFSPFRWEQLPHLQVLLMPWIPLTLWSFDRLLERVSWRRAGLFLLFYLLQVAGGNYLAGMVHVPLLVLLLNRLAWRRRRESPFSRRELGVLSTSALAAAAAVAAFYGPYLAAQRIWPLRWSPEVLRVWGASVLSYLTPAASNLYSGLWPEALRRPENSLFPGWLASLFAACGVVDLLRRRGAAGPAPPAAELVRPAAELPEPARPAPELPERVRPAAELPEPVRPAAGAETPPRTASLPRGRRVALGVLLAVALVGFLFGELHTWSREMPALERLVPGAGYRIPGALCLGGLAAWLLLRRRWRDGWPLPTLPLGGGLDPWSRGLLLAGLATAALSTPIFFGAVRGMIPGFAAMRVPARFAAFTSFSIAYFAGLGLDGRLAARRGREPERATPRRQRSRQDGTVSGAAPRGGAAAGVIALIAALLALELAPRPIPWLPLPREAEFPAVYAWLRHQPAVGPLLELPFGEEAEDEIAYMYFGTAHWKPLVNGYSARFPPDFELLQDLCCWPVPEGPALALLRRWRVGHVLIHTGELRPGQLGTLAAWQARGLAAQVYQDDDGDRVYRLLPDEAAGVVSGWRKAVR